VTKDQKHCSNEPQDNIHSDKTTKEPPKHVSNVGPTNWKLSQQKYEKASQLEQMASQMYAQKAVRDSRAK